MSKSAFRIAAFAAGASLALAASAQAVVITINDANGNAGDTVPVTVSLNTEGASVAGTQNDIAFAAPIAIAAKANKKPDCAVNDAIDKGGTSFAFQPSGCTAGTDCTGIRALVLALDNVSPILDGSVLYTCQVAIASGAADGNYALTNSNEGASDPDGNALATTGVSGNVTVGTPVEGTVIHVGNASGAAGSTVPVEVSLTTPASIAGTQNDIAFAAPIAIAAKPNNKPDCAVNEAIDKGGTSFAFQPSGCTPGTDCTGIRALVLALDNVAPIQSGSVLYTCQVAIAAGASGDSTLTCSNAGASDPDGNAVAADCTNGTVSVGGEDTPTATPTETAGPPTVTNTPAHTPTNTPVPTNTKKPTNTPGGGGGNDDDGCNIVAPAQSSNAWMLLLPAAALLWLRRRSR